MECTENAECTTEKVCQNFLCVDPCALNFCGVNAECSVMNHTSICKCQSGFSGDPFVSCDIQAKRTTGCRLNIRPTSTTTTPPPTTTLATQATTSLATRQRFQKTTPALVRPTPETKSDLVSKTKLRNRISLPNKNRLKKQSN